MSNSVSAADKRFVAERAGYVCEYCFSQLRYSPDPFSVDHIVPVARGGFNNVNNLALACQGCNGFKFTATEAVDPITGETAPLYNPRRDRWSEHFAWNVDFTLILGITPIGRATVARLQINRPGVTDLRIVLRAFGRHPPS